MSTTRNNPCYLSFHRNFLHPTKTTAVALHYPQVHPDWPRKRGIRERKSEGGCIKVRRGETYKGFRFLMRYWLRRVSSIFMTLFLHHHGAPYLQSVFLLRHSLHPRTQHRLLRPRWWWRCQAADIGVGSHGCLLPHSPTSLRPKGPNEIERVAGRALLCVVCRGWARVLMALLKTWKGVQGGDGSKGNGDGELKVRECCDERRQGNGERRERREDREKRIGMSSKP